MAASEKSQVTVEGHGEVALLLIDNPPVNALSDAMRRDLMQALDEVQANRAFRAAVIACAGRTFIVGADITQFGTRREIPTYVIAARLAGMPIPMVAALHGTALGGGCELALGCHARVMARDGFVGVPEVRIGLIPSGGGTQRLTRLVGPLAALDLISTGRQVQAEEALRLGLVDAVADDVRAAAIQHARELALTGERRRIADRSFAASEIAEFKVKAQQVKTRAGGALAMRRGIEAIEYALDHTLEEGVALEQRLSVETHASPQSHAMRYLFNAERLAANLRTQDRPKAIRHVVVVGQGEVAQHWVDAIRKAGLTVQRIQAATLAAGMPATDLILLMQDAVDELGVLSRRSENSPIVALALPFGVAVPSRCSENITPFLLRYAEPFARHRLLQIVPGAGASEALLASLLRFGRSMGRAAIFNATGAELIANRMVAAGRQVLDGARSLGAAEAELAELERYCGLATSQARSSDVGAMPVCSDAARAVLAAMVNEGARILSEQKATHAALIDLVLVHACAYPAWRGGPMYEADVLGAARILDMLGAAKTGRGDNGSSVDPLLLRLASEGGLFRDVRNDVTMRGVLYFV